VEISLLTQRLSPWRSVGVKMMPEINSLTRHLNLCRDVNLRLNSDDRLSYIAMG
jgi:hypothetical protein